LIGLSSGNTTLSRDFGGFFCLQKARKHFPENFSKTIAFLGRLCYNVHKHKSRFSCVFFGAIERKKKS